MVNRSDSERLRGFDDRQTDGWMDGRTDGRTDRKTFAILELLWRLKKRNFLGHLLCEGSEEVLNIIPT